MSENARGKGRKRELGSLTGSRQIPSVVQPSGASIDDLVTDEPPPQMGQQAAPRRQRRSQAKQAAPGSKQSGSGAK